MVFIIILWSHFSYINFNFAYNFYFIYIPHAFSNKIICYRLFIILTFLIFKISVLLTSHSQTIRSQYFIFYFVMLVLFSNRIFYIFTLIVSNRNDENEKIFFSILLLHGTRLPIRSFISASPTYFTLKKCFCFLNFSNLSKKKSLIYNTKRLDYTRWMGKQREKKFRK